jgi:glycosyltransferase involved in cell wall biosynthesis
MISVLILTKNEEQDLPGCLASVSWSDDVHVFDSESTDATAAIARATGATVTTRPFDGYASQRNAALDTLPFRNPWILILDADERTPDVFGRQLQSAVRTAGAEVNGFRFRRRDYLHGSWLKYSQISPYYIRLIRHGRARYHREINEVLEVDGKVVDLDGHFDHFPFSKGIRHWVDKHNLYSSMEATRWLQEEEADMEFSWRSALFDRDFNVRRYHQKGLFYRLPGRPLLKWAYMMFFRRGILDGRAGWTYAALQAIYEYLIVLKYREQKLNLPDDSSS